MGSGHLREGDDLHAGGGLVGASELLKMSSVVRAAVRAAECALYGGPPAWRGGPPG